MNGSSGKIYGPAGLVTVASVFIVMLLIGGVAIGFTRNRTYRIAERIGELDRQNRDLDEKCRKYKDDMAAALDILALRNSPEVRGRLDTPTKEQLVTLRRRTGYHAAPERRVSGDPRFTALDIAYIRTTADRGTAVR